ncbi:AbrB/MazE/SpoVT family DNA-binding domain-containing protein [Neomoorella thermoacetica]|uniref:AbrB/MazE/SpoVT family DNA-binding domain-containing protein n=1 Tax=Neomoorella thermoacetica TaxID=1525 RepID=UPI00324848DF
MSKQVEITKLSSRGQVVIPKEIRQQLGWETGDHVAVEVRGGYSHPAAPAARKLPGGKVPAGQDEFNQVDEERVRGWREKPGANLPVKYPGREYLALGKPAAKYGRPARIL